LNLVTTENKNEKMLKTRYEEMISTCGLKDKQLKYKYFDFHVQCHKNSDPLMELVEKFVFPTNIEKSGIFSKTFRVVTENISGQPIERIIAN